MHHKRGTIIAAVAANRVIGVDGGLPWNLPEDLRWFSEQTQGHDMIVGRKTYEGFGDAPLSGGNRRCIVVSHYPWEVALAPGDKVAASVEEALKKSDDPEPMIIGGGKIYAYTMENELSDRLLITRVSDSPKPDPEETCVTLFPKLPTAGWGFTALRRVEADERHSHGFSICEYTRR